MLSLSCWKKTLTISLLILNALFLSPIQLLFALDVSFVTKPRQDQLPTYNQYLSHYQPSDKGLPDKDYIVRPKDHIDGEGRSFIDRTSYEVPVVISDETTQIRFSFNVEKAGLYSVEISYIPIPGRGLDIERELRINGEIPFEGAQYIKFNRTWEYGSPVRKDVQGNEISPKMTEAYKLTRYWLSDSQGYIQDPYEFFFKEGQNTIEFIPLSDSFAIVELRLTQYTRPAPYGVVEKTYPTHDPILFLQKLQERDTAYVSHSFLTPLFDQGEPEAEPYNPARITLNALGGNRWKNFGESVTWEFSVPEAGLYGISVKGKQNITRGTFSSRQLRIDGKVPFLEAGAISFPFSQQYRMYTVSTDRGEPAYFYLDPGIHTLTLEVSLGELAPVLQRMEELLYDVNQVYRRIIMITSTDPDPLRTYELEKRIPGVIDSIGVLASRLSELSRELEEITGSRDGQVAVLNRQINLFKRMEDRPDRIPQLLNEYADSAAALGTWITLSREQPVLVDYVLVSGKGTEIPGIQNSWLKRLWHEIRSFFVSFFFDYGKIGSLQAQEGKEEREIKVWVGSGRDQAQILKEMIEDDFTPNSECRVNLELVQNINGSGSVGGNSLLIPSIMAGRAPDVVLGAANMDVAFRGAALDLQDFPDFESISKRFKKSAFVPFQSGGAIYALPEAQSFSVLFYRKDILSELDLTVPQTWDEVRLIIPILKKNNLDFGLMSNMGTYLMLLYQQGLSFYSTGALSTNLLTEEAIAVFEEYTDFFTLYQIPMEFNAENRFRMGEMPLLVANYGMYNTLKVFASELRGEWGFALLPGTVMRDGTIRRTVCSIPLTISSVSQAVSEAGMSGMAAPLEVSGAVILKDSVDYEASWEFLKWWTSADVQVRYGNELEKQLGPAARYATANVEAFQRLPWTYEERKILLEQWNWTEGYPFVPGYYYAGRQFEWAFRAVVVSKKPMRETLIYYDRRINEELLRKRREFGLILDANLLTDAEYESYWSQFTHLKAPEGASL